MVEAHAASWTLHWTSRSPASRIQQQLQPYSADSLQSAVPAPRQLAAPTGAIRRGVVASADTGATGTWKKDKVTRRHER